jgi:hypothetical protein
MRIASAGNAILMDLHDLQRRGTQTETQLAAIYPEMSAAASKVKAASDIPSGVKSQFDALQKDFDAVRVKFGVGPSTDTTVASAGGRGGRGGGGRGGAGRGGAGGGNESANELARVATLKAAIGGIWETPSDASNEALRRCEDAHCRQQSPKRTPCWRRRARWRQR